MEYLKRNRNGMQDSVLDIYSSKSNPLFSNLAQLVCNTDLYQTKYVEIDVDHKVMGNFNPCRFEML